MTGRLTVWLVLTMGHVTLAQAQEPEFQPPDVASELTPDKVPTPSDIIDLSEEAKTDPDAPWSLTDIFTDRDGANLLKDNGWTIFGSTVQSLTFNFDSPRDRFNGPVTYTDRSNDYQLNQQWLGIERLTDTTDKDWDLGARADIAYGTNSRFFTATGLEDNINGGQAFYALALPQFYVDLAYRKLKVRAGHFIAPIGFNTVDISKDFFNTIPYTFQYDEPFTHTGALAIYDVNERLTISSGVINGWDNFSGGGLGSPNLGYLGTMTLKFEDKSELSWGGIWSNEANGGGGFSSRYVQTLVYRKPINERLEYVIQSDFGTQGNTVNGNGGGEARWYGLNQYLFYKQNDQWTWGLNFEIFRDQDGFRVAGFLPNPPATPETSRIRGWSPAFNSYVGNFYQITMGPQWKFHKNMMLRPNLRFDWFGGQANNTNGPGGSALLPYGDGTKRSQAILGTDLVITY